MPDYVIRPLTLGAQRPRQVDQGSKILILGLAYKPNTTHPRIPQLRAERKLDARGCRRPITTTRTSPLRTRCAVRPRMASGARSREMRKGYYAALVATHNHAAYDWQLISDPREADRGYAERAKNVTRAADHFVGLANGMGPTMITTQSEFKRSGAAPCGIWSHSIGLAIFRRPSVCAPLHLFRRGASYTQSSIGSVRRSALAWGAG